MSKIQVIAVDNCINFYPKNLLRNVFEFRHEMVTRLGWSQGLALQKTPMSGTYTETDDQDKPGTVYFTKLDGQGNVVGVIRVTQSLDTCGKHTSMIHQAFNHLVAPEKPFPAAHNVWETSRILIDQQQYKTPDERRPIVDELIMSTFFYAQQKNIRALFCFMSEGLWESTYKRIGFEVEKLGPNYVIEDNRTYNVYAGIMQITDEIMQKTSAATGLSPSILDFGREPVIERVPVFQEQPMLLSI